MTVWRAALSAAWALLGVRAWPRLRSLLARGGTPQLPEADPETPALGRFAPKLASTLVEADSLAGARLSLLPEEIAEQRVAVANARRDFRAADSSQESTQTFVVEFGGACALASGIIAVELLMLSGPATAWARQQELPSKVLEGFAAVGFSVQALFLLFLPAHGVVRLSRNSEDGWGWLGAALLFSSSVVLAALRMPSLFAFPLRAMLDGVLLVLMTHVIPTFAAFVLDTIRVRWSSFHEGRKQIRLAATRLADAEMELRRLEREQSDLEARRLEVADEFDAAEILRQHLAQDGAFRVAADEALANEAWRRARSLLVWLALAALTAVGFGVLTAAALAGVVATLAA